MSDSPDPTRSEVRDAGMAVRREVRLLKKGGGASCCGPPLADL